MKKVRKTSKKFLSDTPYEYGSVCWEVVVDPDDSYELVSADLRISDCSEKVNLSFSSRKKKYIAYRVKKLDVLIAELQAMREFLSSDKVVAAVDKKVKNKKDKE